MEVPLGQDTIDFIHTIVQQQGMPQVNGKFVYESLSGQEFDFGDNDEDSQYMGFIDMVEENKHHDDDGEDIISIESGEDYDDSQDVEIKECTKTWKTKDHTKV